MTAVVFGESRDRELNICSIGKGRLRQGHFPVYKYPLANTVMEGRKHIATSQAGGIKNKWPEVNKESVQPADLEKILSIMRSWGKDRVWMGDVGASPVLRPHKEGSDQCLLLGSTLQLLAAVLEEALGQRWVLQGGFQVLLLGSPPKTWPLVQPVPSPASAGYKSWCQAGLRRDPGGPGHGRCQLEAGRGHADLCFVFSSAFSWSKAGTTFS